MKIHKLVLQNFRGFQDLTLDLDGENVVLVGKNGAGKSSVLDAVGVLLSSFVEVCLEPKVSTRDVVNSDIFNGAPGLSMSMDFELDGKQHTCVYTFNSHISHVEFNTEDYDDKSLPILAYYPVNRTVLESLDKMSEVNEFGSSDAYERALTSGTDFRMFFEWYRYREDIENEAKIRERKFDLFDIQLEAVRRAIYAFLPGFSNLRVNRRPQQLLIDKGGKSLQLNQLSDGEKCMLALVGDLARRLALINPTLENPSHGHGVVLIDEIELHLHPEWQREVIPRLRATFPNVQFIISTHSPQVLGEVQDMKIFQLETTDTGITVTPHPTVFGKDSNRILEDVLGSVLRNREVKKQIEDLFDAITHERWEEVRELKETLVENVGTDEPELIKADVLIRKMRRFGK